MQPFSRGRLGYSEHGDLSGRDDQLRKRALEWPLMTGKTVRKVLPPPLPGFYLFSRPQGEGLTWDLRVAAWGCRNQDIDNYTLPHSK